MERILKIFILMVVIASNSAFAWKGQESTIKSVHVNGLGAVVVTFHTETSNTCTAKEYYLEANVAEVSLESFKNMYTALLMAAASGKMVNIQYQDINDPQCHINRLTVYM